MDDYLMVVCGVSGLFVKSFVLMMNSFANYFRIIASILRICSHGTI